MRNSVHYQEKEQEEAEEPVGHVERLDMLNSLVLLDYDKAQVKHTDKKQEDEWNKEGEEEQGGQGAMDEDKDKLKESRRIFR